MWVKSEAKRWGSCRALGERAPEIYNWDSGVGVGCWAVSWLWSKNTTGAPSSGTGWVCWWSSLSTNHWTLAGSGFAFFFSMIFRLKRNPTILFFFLRFYSLHLKVIFLIIIFVHFQNSNMPKSLVHVSITQIQFLIGVWHIYWGFLHVYI